MNPNRILSYERYSEAAELFMSESLPVVKGRRSDGVRNLSHKGVEVAVIGQLGNVIPTSSRLNGAESLLLSVAA